MNLSILKKYWYIFILIIIVFALFFPIHTTYDEPFKIYHSLIDLGFADYGVFSALIVGLLSFTATIYTNDKNLKATKLTTLPEDYMELTLPLEFLFVEHNIEKILKIMISLIHSLDFLKYGAHINLYLN